MGGGVDERGVMDTKELPNIHFSVRWRQASMPVLPLWEYDIAKMSCNHTLQNTLAVGLVKEGTLCAFLISDAARGDDGGERESARSR